jgi:hypothetical protein
MKYERQKRQKEAHKHMITSETIRTEFQRLLAENNVTKTFKVEADARHPFRMSISSRGNGLILTYNPNITRYNSMEELLCDLRHELCHVVKSPTFDIVMLDLPGSFNKDCLNSYVDIFREYIAEEENAKRFPSHMQAYLAHRKKLYKPAQILLDGMQHIKKGLIPSDDYFPFIMSMIFVIFSESTCFYVANDKTLTDLCRQEIGEHLNTLFLYIMEDMKNIEDRAIPYMEKMKLLLHSFSFCMCVDMQNIWNGKGLCMLRVPNSPHIDREIARLWQARNIPRLTTF